MKVHVVCQDFEHGQYILPRLSRMLTEATGWTGSAVPRAGVDLNYFFTYIELAERNPQFKATPKAAWFSHYETNRARKAGWWDQAATMDLLRTTCVEQYRVALADHGPTALVMPPVDRNLYTPGPPVSAPVVGFSGYVDSAKKWRKGLDLVEQLVSNALADRVVFRACGAGWPCHTVNYPEQAMPDFYRGLRLYVCPSRIEGIPMPPLEALACGIPVVIPRGVGMLDALPEMSGIYRFEAGNAEALLAAIEQALADAPPDPEQLRAVTEPYTPQTWVASHERAFEDYLYEGAYAPPQAEVTGNCGVYMVAYGEPARQCAEQSITTIHQHMPGVPVALVSDRPLGIEDVCACQPDADLGGRAAKLNIWNCAPAEWEYVLYLDADTELVAPVNIFFDLLASGFEFVFTLLWGKYFEAGAHRRPNTTEQYEAIFREMGTEHILQPSGGAWAFRRCARAETFLKTWLENWQAYATRDQPPLLKTFLHVPVRAAWLSNYWHYNGEYPDVGEVGFGIWHFPLRARRWSGYVTDRWDTIALQQ